MSDSMLTKKAIAQSIKELMRKKELQRISVADIVSNCGINRQTFYYHFRDKYDLVNWIYYTEVVTAILYNPEFKEWTDGILFVLQAMKKEQYFYSNALRVVGQNALQEYFYEVTKGLFLDRLNAFRDDGRMSWDDKVFIAEFYANGFVGIVVKWAQNGMKEPPKEMVRRITALIETVRYYAGSKDHLLT